MTDIRNEKQWLAKIQATVSKIKTATPAKNVASRQRHQGYQEGEADKNEDEEERSGEE